MKVTEVVYSRTVQIKQYEPAHVEVRITLEDGDKPSNAINHAKALVNESLGVR